MQESRITLFQNKVKTLISKRKWSKIRRKDVEKISHFDLSEKGTALSSFLLKFATEIQKRNISDFRIPKVTKKCLEFQRRVYLGFNPTWGNQINYISMQIFEIPVRII